MTINFIPNDPLAGSKAPGIRSQTKRPNRPASRASFTLSGAVAEAVLPPGTPGFLFWQCREAALSALAAWESFAGPHTRWQGNRKKLLLLQDVGIDINAFYDRSSFSFFHRLIGSKTYFSGASTDVVAHEVGHGLLDSIRPDLWDAPFLETGAFHEAFGDCMAILTALEDQATRKKLLAVTTSLKKKNFVEGTAEELSDGIRRLVPTHNAATPRRAFNTFKFQIPETLPDDGGPGALINEVHSFGMLFSGCFYDLIVELFGAQSSRTEATLLTAARKAGSILVGGAKTALIGPRFLQSVGRAMILFDQQANAGANREHIKKAFENHQILLGTNAMLAPAAALAGPAPRGRRATITSATRKDLLQRLGAERGARLAVEPADVMGQRFARAVHTREVGLGTLDARLRGVTIEAQVPVMVGSQGTRAAVLGRLPEPTSVEREVQAFVQSLIKHGHIEFGGATRSRRGAAADVAKRAPVSRETHRIIAAGDKRVLQRVRFHCSSTRG